MSLSTFTIAPTCSPAATACSVSSANSSCDCTADIEDGPVGFVIRDETAAAASIFAAAAEGEAYDDDSVAASPLAAAMNCEGGSHVVSRVPDAECEEKRDVGQNPT